MAKGQVVNEFMPNHFVTLSKRRSVAPPEGSGLNSLCSGCLHGSDLNYCVPLP